MMKQVIAPTRFSKLRYTLLIGLILFIYFLDNPYFKTILDSNMLSSVLKSILWLGMGVLVCFFPAARPVGKLKTRGSLYFWAFNFAVIIIIVQMIAGFFDALGKSPYDHSIIGILINTLNLAPVLFGHEFARHYLVNSITHDEEYRVFIGVALFITVISFSLDKFMGFKSNQEAVIFVAQYFLPEFSRNLLATVLAYFGGPLTSIIFMGTLEAFHWFSPILPDLKWIIAALVGILTPVFLLISEQIIYEDVSKARKRNLKNEENPLSWILTISFSIGIVWFSVGVFPVYPSVIATGSMEPMIRPGDVILVDKKIDTNQLIKNDVIQFRRDNILISHRIIEVIEEDGAKNYRTQGDNNSGPDFDLVKPEEVKGRVIKVIPKIGWPTLLIKSNKDIPLEKVQF